MLHRHNGFVPGHTYFFTQRLLNGRSDLLVRHIDVLRAATRLAQKRWPFEIAAACVLPNHLHMIWVLPDNDDDTAKRWRLIKSSFSRNVPAPDYIAPSAAKRGHKGIWQRGAWGHLIKDQDDFDRHAHVIRAAPVQAGLVKRPSEWPFCSLHHRLRRGARTTGPVPSGPDQAADATSIQTAPIAASKIH